MAQGLQCWDAGGTMVVDIGDYNMRYMGSVGLNIAAGTNSWNVGFGGMRTTGWLAILRTTQYYNEFYCIPNNDSFTVQYLPSSGVYAQSLTFDVYSYNTL